MNCQEVLDLMQKYVDQEHTNSEYAEMSEHLHRCPSCTAIFERLKRLSDELEQLPKVVPAYSIVDTILPKLERMNLLYQPTWKERFMERFPYKTLGSLAAGIILLLVILNSDLPGSMNSADSEKSALHMESMNRDTAGNNLAPAQEDGSDNKAKVEFSESVTESPTTPAPTAEMESAGETTDAEATDSSAADPVGEAKLFKATSPPATKKPTPKPAAASTPEPQATEAGGYGGATVDEEPAVQEENNNAELAPSQSPSAVLTTDAEQFPSGDGAYIAYVRQNETSQEVVIVNQQFEPVFTSFAKEVEQILNIVWSEESKVLWFDTFDGQTTRHYSVDLVKLQESEHVR
ncbi:MAG TPA: zf-HC2 domain-containing protein [Bacilli bacterium]